MGTTSMKSTQLLALLSLLFASANCGVIVSGTLNNREGLVNPNKVTVTLAPGGYSAFVDKSNHFSIHNVQPGTYILEAHDNENYFEPYLVYVGERERDGKHSVNVTLHSLRPGEKKKWLRYPVSVHPSFPIEYFDPEQPFSVMNLAKNPMFVMIGMSVLMYICMQNMPKPDKEAMKEANEQFKNMRL
eukprot:TRINITY_DN9851_c0_g1_i1.p1 TRINITY_DN9851_c0_g1~~TRINITY_DN9851_c0_g1_i1.p1  ORF type:complete len:187 (-),score=53.14 TRINITY_DN9851_c0_g1_i1:125-685(-)